MNKTLSTRLSTETKRKNKRPIGVSKTGNRHEKTGPKLLGRFDRTKIAPHMASLGIFLGTFSPKLHQNAHFCAPGKTLSSYRLFKNNQGNRIYKQIVNLHTVCVPTAEWHQ